MVDKMEVVTDEKGTYVNRQLTSVGDHLKEARQSLGWSLRRAEVESGVSNGYISQVERGDVEPSPAVLLKLSNAYALEYDYLMEVAGYITRREETASPLTERIPAHLFSTISQLNDDEWKIAQDLMKNLIAMRQKHTDTK